MLEQILQNNIGDPTIIFYEKLRFSFFLTTLYLPKEPRKATQFSYQILHERHKPKTREVGA
jgi:hypothetical protein